MLEDLSTQDPRKTWVGEWVMVALIIVAILMGVISMAVPSTSSAARCLEKGYTQAHVVREDREWVVYCSRLENGTERVVPLIGE